MTAFEICRLAPSQVYRALTTSPQGLSQDDVRRRTIRHGPNSLQELRGVPLLSRFARQFTHSSPALPARLVSNPVILRAWQLKSPSSSS